MKPCNNSIMNISTVLIIMVTFVKLISWPISLLSAKRIFAVTFAVTKPRKWFIVLHFCRLGCRRLVPDASRSIFISLRWFPKSAVSLWPWFLNTSLRLPFNFWFLEKASRMAITYVALKAPLQFTQEDMPQCRRHIAQHIISNKYYISDTGQQNASPSTERSMNKTPTPNPKSRSKKSPVPLEPRAAEEKNLVESQATDGFKSTSSANLVCDVPYVGM